MTRLPLPRRSLRTRLVALLLATVAVMCLVIGVVTHASVRDQLSAELDAQLARVGSRAIHQVQDGDDAQTPGPGTGPGASDGGTDGGTDGGFEGAVDGPGGGEGELMGVAVDGQLAAASWRDASGQVHELSAADRDLLAAALADGDAGARGGRDVELSIGDYRVAASAAPGGETVISGLPRGPMQSTLARLDLTLALASLGALLVTGIAGSFIVRRTMRPLEEVARIASDVAAMPLESGTVTLAERAPPEREGTEVGEVSRALNHLLDNVEGALTTRQRSEERMRRFIADASHELRTPLTSIRGYTEMLRLTEDLSEDGSRSVNRLDAQSRRMTSLVEDLLLLARLDDGAPRADDELDLGEIVVESLLDAQVTGGDHTWTLDVPDEPVLVRGDARQLTQVVVNLLSNARKHTPAGTSVAARLRLEGRREAVLEIIDDGPGIPAALQEEVFGRFTRADAARSGGEGTSGLGLPIVRAITTSHGGLIELDSRPGRTAFTVRLPLAATA